MWGPAGAACDIDPQEDKLIHLSLVALHPVDVPVDTNKHRAS